MELEVYEAIVKEKISLIKTEVKDDADDKNQNPKTDKAKEPEKKASKKRPKQAAAELKFKWNRCIIPCALCSQPQTSLAYYYLHLQKAHQTNIKETPFRDGCLPPKHDCLVCKIKVNFEQKRVANHLKSAHDMTLKAYEERFPTELEALFSSLGEIEEPPKSSRHTKEKNHGLVQLQPEEFSKTKRGLGLLFKWNRSQVLCPICSDLQTGLGVYRRHLKKEHNTSIKATPLKKRSRPPKHGCLLCKARLIFEQKAVTAHLRYSHNISLKAYEQKFLSELKTLFRSINEKNGLNSVKAEPYELRGEELNETDSIPVEIDKPTGKLMFKWNRCPISCVLCSKQLINVSMYRIHLREVHRTSIKETPLDKERPVPKHLCLLCSSQVIFEQKSVMAHLRTTHRVSLKTYEQRFSSDLEALFHSMNELSSPWSTSVEAKVETVIDEDVEQEATDQA